MIYYQKLLWLNGERLKKRLVLRVQSGNPNQMCFLYVFVMFNHLCLLLDGQFWWISWVYSPVPTSLVTLVEMITVTEVSDWWFKRILYSLYLLYPQKLEGSYQCQFTFHGWMAQRGAFGNSIPLQLEHQFINPCFVACEISMETSASVAPGFQPFMVAGIHQELPRSRMFGLESVVPPMKWTCLWYVHFGTTRVTPCSDIDCCLVPIFVAWHSRLHFVWFKLYSVGQVSPSWSRIRLIEHDESMLNRPRAVVETCLNPEIRAWFMHVYDQF